MVDGKKVLKAVGLFLLDVIASFFVLLAFFLDSSSWKPEYIAIAVVVLGALQTLLIAIVNNYLINGT